MFVDGKRDILWRYVDDDNPITKPEVKVESTTVSAEQVAKSKEKVNEHNLKEDKAYSLIALSGEPDVQIHVLT